jgi:hypothetical protein
MCDNPAVDRIDAGELPVYEVSAAMVLSASNHSSRWLIRVDYTMHARC